jgi:very-short-patch-repair endonuclease
VGEKSARSDPDTAIARIAARQHGVVSVTQLNNAGTFRSGIARRVKAGRLHRIYRAVYAVGHRGLSQEGRWMAAVLACGPGAVLSHRSAAELWGMLKPRPGPIDVTIPGYAGRKRRAGIRLHRSATLLPRCTTLRAAIPVTTPGRTLDDIPRVAPVDVVLRARREAEFCRLPLGEPAGEEQGGTELEHRFIRLCRRHRVPVPEANVPIGPYEVDFLWRDGRLIVEVDGWEGHGTRTAFEEDRARDAHLATLGYAMLRFTWRQVVDEPKAVAATVRALLVAR